MRWTLFCEASALLSKLLSAGAAGDYDYSGADTNSGARARSSAVELRTFNPGVVGSNPTGPSMHTLASLLSLNFDYLFGSGRLPNSFWTPGLEDLRPGGRAWPRTSGHRGSKQVTPGFLGRLSASAGQGNTAFSVNVETRRLLPHFGSSASAAGRNTERPV